MTYKLQVKLGTAEFSAEGPEESVKEQFNAFLAAAQAIPAAPPNRLASSPLRNGSGNGATLLDNDSLNSENISRVFSTNDEGSVSLRIMPRTERRDADALILLLYGFRTLANQTDVNSGILMQAARQSGLQFNRLDNTISVYQHLITEGGLRRGKRYGINNQGTNHAEELIRAML